MKRSLGIGCLVLLLLAFFLSPAVATTAGSKCSVLNKKVRAGSVTLVCKKNAKGTKVWTKVTAIKPTPTPTATPTPTPTPTSPDTAVGRYCTEVDATIKVLGTLNLICFPNAQGLNVWTTTADATALASRSEYVRSNARCYPLDATALDASSKKFTCVRGPEGYVTWQPLIGGVDPVPPRDTKKLLVDIVPENYRNGAFELHTKFYSTVAQSLLLEKNMRIEKMALATELIKVAVDSRAFSGGYDPTWEVVHMDSAFSAPATINVAFWARDDQRSSSETIDLREGYTKVLGEQTKVSIPAHGTFEIELKHPVAIRSGEYVISLYVTFDDPMVSIVRFKGQQSGDNRRSGPNDDRASDCVYTPTTDIYPQGRAYRTGDTFNLFSDGSASVFIRHRSKVGGDCTGVDKDGYYKDVFNQGDIAIQLYGSIDSAVRTPTSGEPWSLSGTKAALVQSAYSGLSCSPFATQLEKVELPDGVGPEARVAAACMWLDWFQNAKRIPPAIDVITSPTVPSRVNEEIKRSILAGDRLFGRYAKKITKYEYLFSVDEEWMCTEGQKLVEPRLVGLAARWESRYNPGIKWSTNRNTGCAGSPYSFASSEPKNLGADLDIFFSWSLISPADNKPGRLENYDEWLWWLRVTNHEYVHSIQIQRSGVDGSDRWGSWFGEGQATYLGYTAAALSAGPADMRQFALNELARDLTASGLEQIRLQDLGNGPASSRALFYSAGYFAYEYLVAHFGIEKVWALWDAWAAPVTSTEQCPCANSRASKHFGVDSDILLNQMNEYINAQLKLRRP